MHKVFDSLEDNLGYQIDRLTVYDHYMTTRFPLVIWSHRWTSVGLLQPWATRCWLIGCWLG